MSNYLENSLFGLYANYCDREEIIKEIARRAAAGETNFTIDSAWDLTESDLEYIRNKVGDYLS